MMSAMNDEDDEWPGVGAMGAMGATACGLVVLWRVDGGCDELDLGSTRLADGEPRPRTMEPR